MSDKKPYGFSKQKSRKIHDYFFGAHQGTGNEPTKLEQRRVAIASTGTSVVAPIDSLQQPQTTLVTIYGSDGTSAIASQVTETAVNATDVCMKPSRLAVMVREYVGGEWVPCPMYGRKLIVKTGSSGIPGLSTSNVPGTATVAICKDDGTNGLVTVSTAIGKNIDADSIPGNKYAQAAEEDISGVLLVEQLAITNLRLNGNEYQYYRAGDWITWVTGSDCPDTTT